MLGTKKLSSSEKLRYPHGFSENRPSPFFTAHNSWGYLNSGDDALHTYSVASRCALCAFVCSAKWMRLLHGILRNLMSSSIPVPCNFGRVAGCGKTRPCTFGRRMEDLLRTRCTASSAVSVFATHEKAMTRYNYCVHFRVRGPIIQQ